jgi:hypothetical protein
LTQREEGLECCKISRNPYCIEPSPIITLS